MRLIGKELEVILKLLKQENLKFTIAARYHILACEEELKRIYTLVYDLSEENRKLKEELSNKNNVT